MDRSNLVLRPSAIFANSHYGGSAISVVEVGVYLGFNAVAMIEKMKISRLILVDPYETNRGYDDIQERDNIDLCDACITAHENIGENGVVSWIKMKSIDAASSLTGTQYDYIYIDGDHRYESVSADISAWWPLVKSGGIFAGHDYHSAYKPEVHYGIDRAVDEFASANNLSIQTEEIDWWVVKG